MITETRELIFSRDALQEVFKYHGQSPQSELSSEAILDVYFEQEPETAVLVVQHPRGARQNEIKRFSPAETVAAVIRYCQHHDIPVPKTARKALEVVQDKAHIRFVQDLHPQGER